MDGGDTRDSNFGLSETQLDGLLKLCVDSKSRSLTDAGADAPLARDSEWGV